MNAEIAFLASLIMAALIGGIPSVLFARLLRKTGLVSLWASILASAFIPVIWTWQMTGGDIVAIPETPWWFFVVTYVGGLLTCWAYFRRAA